MDRLLNRNAELQAEIIMLNNILVGIEDKIAIYSNIDMVRVGQLAESKREIEAFLLDVLCESNSLWLHSILSKKKVA